MTYVLRTSLPHSTMSGALRRAVAEVQPTQPLYAVRSVEGFVHDATAERRFYMFLLGSFAALAVALAAIGIYGVVSYAVAQRTREIGVRMALGARQNDVLKMVIGRGLIPAALGVVTGLAGSLAATRYLRSQLYGVTPTDPATFAAVSALFVAVTVLASYIPARRATKVDPSVALRYE